MTCVQSRIFLLSQILFHCGVSSIPANSDAQNVPLFRRWRFVMKLSPLFFVSLVCQAASEFDKQRKKCFVLNLRCLLVDSVR